MPRTKSVDLDALLDEQGNEVMKGHDIRSLGPSDSSDTGADMVGLGGLDSTSDRHGTGERGSVEGDLDMEPTSRPMPSSTQRMPGSEAVSTRPKRPRSASPMNRSSPLSGTGSNSSADPYRNRDRAPGAEEA